MRNARSFHLFHRFFRIGGRVRVNATRVEALSLIANISSLFSSCSPLSPQLLRTQSLLSLSGGVDTKNKRKIHTRARATRVFPFDIVDVIVFVAVAVETILLIKQRCMQMVCMEETGSIKTVTMARVRGKARPGVEKKRGDGNR